jgi:hypothetical protein
LALCVLAPGVFEREGLLGTDMAGRAIGTHDEVFTDRFHRFVKRAIFGRISRGKVATWYRIGTEGQKNAKIAPALFLAGGSLESASQHLIGLHGGGGIVAGHKVRVSVERD